MGEKFRQWSFREERVDGEIEKEEREENKKNERDEREISGEIEGVKYIYFFFCNTMNSAILCLELYCSSIAKKICNTAVYNSLMQEFFRLKMPNFP